MKRFLLLALVFSVMVTTAPALADGDFYVVAGGGGVGTKISSLPYTIAAPGFYYLGRDLNYSGNTKPIVIKADNVTLDLMGFCLSYTGTPSNVGIDIMGDTTPAGNWGRKNVEIRNGTVCGFIHGIADSFSTGADHRIINVRAVNNTWNGIYLTGKNSTVKGCTCTNNDVGIYVASGIITSSVASNNRNIGIYLVGPGSVIGNIANDNTTNNIRLGGGNIMVDRNSASGLPSNYGVANSFTGIVWGMNAGNPPYMNYPLPY